MDSSALILCRLPDCDNQATSILNDEESSNEQDDELEDDELA